MFTEFKIYHEEKNRASPYLRKKISGKAFGPETKSCRQKLPNPTLKYPMVRPLVIKNNPYRPWAIWEIQTTQEPIRTRGVSLPVFTVIIQKAPKTEWDFIISLRSCPTSLKSRQQTSCNTR